MKLLWTVDTQYDSFCCEKYNHIIDSDGVVLIPFCGTERDKKITIEYIQIDKKTGRRIDCIPQRIETFDLIHDTLNSEKTYNIGNKIIKSISEHYIECLENQKSIWKFKHWAYLYTEIIEKNNCVIFGTDGMGSRLYCLDTETGKLMSETKTHYSGFYDYNGFNWFGDNMVVYGKDTLIVLNPFTGDIVDEHKIPSKYLYRSFLQVIDNYAYACVLTNSNQPTIMCFQL